jgi:hypothetical protein
MKDDPLLRRVLGDVGDVEADPFLPPDSPTKWWSRLSEPVSLGWFLAVAAVLGLLIILT